MKNRPINEHDEFLLSRLLDDDLPPDEAAGVRARLEQEPELRRAFQAMRRIDTLLVQRRRNQPQVDWTQFHARVMDQVKVEAGHRRVIRLADFLRVSIPLAAAAAIALVVWLWPRGEMTEPVPGDGLPGQRMVERPEDSSGLPAGSGLAEHATEERPMLMVRYHRPNRVNENTDIHVTYARSDDLLKQYRDMDERNQNREPWQTVLASDVRASPPLDLLIEAPLF